MTDNSTIYIPTVSKSLLIVLGTSLAKSSQTPNCSKMAHLLVKVKASLTSARHLLGLFLSVKKKWQFQVTCRCDDCQHRKPLLSVTPRVIHPAKQGTHHTFGRGQTIICLYERTSERYSSRPFRSGARSLKQNDYARMPTKKRELI
jgi:hypothetical protein